MQFQQQVPGLAFAVARRALASKPDDLPFPDALRNLHVESARIEHHPALRVHPRHAQRNLAGRTAESIFQVEQDFGVVIPAVRVRTAGAAHAAEELGEEVAEIGGFRPREPALGEFEPCIPVRRRTEILAGLVTAAELVVGGALFGVRKDRVGLVDLLHAAFRVRLLRHVRVVFARELAVGLLDLLGRGVARHAERLIVVLEFHAFPAFRFVVTGASSRISNISGVRTGKSSC